MSDLVANSYATTDDGGERSNEADEVEVAVDDDDEESGEDGRGGEGVGEPRPIASACAREPRCGARNCTRARLPQGGLAGYAEVVFLPVPRCGRAGEPRREGYVRGRVVERSKSRVVLANNVLGSTRLVSFCRLSLSN